MEDGPLVGFTSAIKRCFRRSFVWKGRAAPSEFWFFALFSFLCLIPINLLLNVLPTALDYLVAAVVEAALFFPLLAAIIRRLHDSGRHGAWFWIGFVPLIGWLIITVLLCQPSDHDANRFGPAPMLKEPTSE